MSVKTMGLVWDMECPKEINKSAFKPSNKFVLIAYADHADHNGRNIYPAVPTIAKKTGYDERSVQRLTRELEEMVVLVADGQGPHGTNRWYIPGGGGDKVSPVTTFRGDIPSGDIPSGDIPSGDSVSPKLKDSPVNLELINIEFGMVWATLKTEIQKELPINQFTKWVEPTRAVAFDGRILTVEVSDEYARDWMNARLRQTLLSALSGIVNSPIGISFVVAEQT